MGRPKPLPHFDRWRVVTTGAGQWRVIGEDGFEPLRHPDRLIRFENTLTICQSTALRACTRELARIVESNLVWDRVTYGPILHASYSALGWCIPTMFEIMRLKDMRDQVEIDFEFIEMVDRACVNAYGETIH